MHLNLSLFVSYFSQYWILTKPRIASSAVFCAVVGMFLSIPGMVPLDILLGGAVGIWSVIASAFSINCFIEQKIDEKMKRTAQRPSVTGAISNAYILFFSFLFAGFGMVVLFYFTNALTMYATFISFIIYTIVYTILLKPTTSQNIVIGGIPGAMPPALGWCAVTNEISAEAWLLVLIIFVWTPPHFWSLALYRREDYKKSGLPMLPVTHGQKFTLLYMVLYTSILFAVTLLPFVCKMSSYFYLVNIFILNVIFIFYTVTLYKRYSDALAKKTFKFSIFYLMCLFTVLLIDHYI